MNAMLIRLVRTFWLVAVILLVAVAAVVSLAKVTLPQLHQYRSEIQAYLSHQLGTPVTFRKIDANWQRFQPTLAVKKLTLGDTEAGVPLSVNTLDLRLDVLKSMVSAHPVFASLLLKKVKLVLRQNEQGQWQFADRVGSARDRPVDLLELLLSQGKIRLEDIGLTLIFSDGVAKQLTIPYLSFHCLKTFCSSKGNAALSGEREGQLDFAMNLTGRPGEAEFGMEAFARWQALPVGDWITRAALEAPKIFDLGGLELGGEFWLIIDKGKLTRVQGKATIPSIELITSRQNVETISDLSTDFLWERPEHTATGNWQLQLGQLSFGFQGHTVSGVNQRWLMAAAGHEKKLNGWVDRMDLAAVVELISESEFLPLKAKNILAALEPRGELSNIWLEVPVAEQNSGTASGFSMRANLVDVAVSDWNHAPAGSGLDGYLEVRGRRGMVQFDSEQFQLHFPRLYSKGWHYQRATGEVSWQIDGSSVWLKGRNLRLTDDEKEIFGQFDLDATKNGAEPRLNLLIGLRGGALRESLAYVPDLKLGNGLVEWLDRSLQSGNIHTASFAYSGSVVKGAGSETRGLRLQVSALVDQFKFLEEWPALEQVKANLVLVDKEVDVMVDSARFYQAVIDNAEANYRPDSSGGVVTVAAGISGEMEDGLRVLQETPIRNALFSLVDDFRVDGALTADLGLSIPLKRQKKVAIDLRLKTQDAQFSIPSLNLVFNHLEGDFRYSDKKGLSGKGITAYLFGEPVTADIDTRLLPVGNRKDVSRQTGIRLQGEISRDAFYDWLPLPALQRVAGKTAYTANMRFGGGQAQQVRIYTDLLGIEAALPEPLTKRADEQKALDFLIRIDEHQTHHLSYDGQVYYALRFDQGAYRQGEINLGGTIPIVGERPGIRITGSLPELDFSQWQSLFELYEQPSNQPSTPQLQTNNKSGFQPPDPHQEDRGFMDRLEQINLTVERFLFADQIFNSLSIKVGKEDKDWRIAVENPQIKGTIVSVENDNEPLVVSLDYLKLPQPEADQTDALQEVIPQQLPLLNFKTGRLSLGEEDYGAWAFNIRPNDKGARVEALNAEVKGLTLSGEIDWRFYSERHFSEFTGMAVARDTGEAVEAWGYSRSIEGEDGKVIGQLKWAGSPARFSLVDSIGELTIKGDQGRFIEVESSANVLRLFGILNFTSLARRLRLDFSDLFKKGYSFDKVRGKLALNQGKVQIVESLIIDGPSAKFKIDGRTDMRTEELDQEMIVVLPLTDNIPLAATIVGAPQVGIPIYLINKVFGNMFERFTSARYKVTGTWENPKIELLKMFENRARQTPAPSPEGENETVEPTQTSEQ